MAVNFLWLRDQLWTDDLREVERIARVHAVRWNRPTVDPEHVLLGTMDDPSGVVQAVLSRLGVEPRQLVSEIERGLPPPSPQIQPTAMPTSEATRAVEKLALDTAIGRREGYVRPVHILLALARTQTSLPGRVLRRLKLSATRISDAIRHLGEVPRLRPRRSREEVHAARMRQIDGLWRRKTGAAQRSLDIAFEQQEALGHGFIGTTHALIGLACAPRSISARALRSIAVTGERLAERAKALRFEVPACAS